MKFRFDSNFPMLLNLEFFLSPHHPHRSSGPPPFLNHLLHRNAVPEYHGRPSYLRRQYLLNGRQSQQFYGAFNFFHFSVSCAFFLVLCTQRWSHSHPKGRKAYQRSITDISLSFSFSKLNNYIYRDLTFNSVKNLLFSMEKIKCNDATCHVGNISF